MDNIDRRLLNILQKEFPLVARPFAGIASRLGIDEREVLARTDRLLSDKVIRKLGASIVPSTLGYRSTLAAAKVSGPGFEAAIEKINGFSQVTHNYERDDEFNVWFTVVGKDRSEIQGIMNEIRSQEGIIELLELPATRIFKIDVFFDFMTPEATCKEKR